MKRQAPQPSSRPPQKWRSSVQDESWDRSPILSEAERKAIRALQRRRFRLGRRSAKQNSPHHKVLERLLAPLQAAVALTSSKPINRPIAVFSLLVECINADSTFWAWDADQWVAVIGEHSRAFTARHAATIGHDVRLIIAAMAILLDCFDSSEVLQRIGPFRRRALAEKVFGKEPVNAAVEEITAPLRQWGYVVQGTVLSATCDALLRNRSPRLADLNAEILDDLRQSCGHAKRTGYYQLAKALAALGYLDAQLPLASSTSGFQREDLTHGVEPAWAEWVERWTATSTLKGRRDTRHHLYKMGRWLRVNHPDISEPQQWTRQLAVEYRAACCQMKVGDYTVRKARLRRQGKPLAPGAIASELVAARTFFWDCQEWGWIDRRFDPGRSLALPRSIDRLRGPNPRVISDDVWARLVWAGLHLEQSDLPAGRNGSEYFPYPLSYMRALAIVWLFSGLRSDEIKRLHVGCVRWQEGIDGRICLLDIPVHKTGRPFTKPVARQVGEAIEAWEAERPLQPEYPDRKTAAMVNLLFMHRAKPLRSELINMTLIPILCSKAGVPMEDTRGAFTSHRARATIASQLFNSREPMSLSELQAWLGHESPASTRHYVSITPTKLTRAYTDAGYFERNMRAIEVLIDQDTVKSASGDGPWRFYDLGHGLCSYEFFDQCAHRMACARCDFYRPRESSLAQLLSAKDNILHLLHEIPLTDEERAVVDGDIKAIDRLSKRLLNEPTPSGQTPEQLKECANKIHSQKDLTKNST